MDHVVVTTVPYQIHTREHDDDEQKKTPAEEAADAEESMLEPGHPQVKS
jgi:hypothetical protein